MSTAARHTPPRRRARAEILDALADGEDHAFVAIDLLWLDGEPLDDVPLLERKRLLDTVLAQSRLVRVTPFVRPAALADGEHVGHPRLRERLLAGGQRALHARQGEPGLGRGAGRRRSASRVPTPSAGTTRADPRDASR